MGLPEAIPRWRTFPFFIYYKRDIFDPILKRSPFIYWYQQYLKAGLEGEFLIKRWVDILYQLVLIEFMTKVIARRGRTTTFAHWYSGEKRGYLKEITEEKDFQIKFLF